MYKAQKLHASLIKNGILLFNVYQCNLLLQSYIKSGALFDAYKLLQLIPHPNIVSYNTILSGFFKSSLVNEALELFDFVPKKESQSWNIVISGFVQNQRWEEALTHFVKMRRGYVRPDNYTYSIVIPCCGFGLGEQVHAEVVKVCALGDEFIGTNLLRMYARVGEMKVAQKVFDEMPRRDLVTWNAMIFGYSKYGMGDLCVELFRQMGIEGIVADEYTYAIVLNEFAAQSQVFEGMEMHSLIIQRGICSDHFICSSLLNLYSKGGFLASALQLFKEMVDPDVVSWTSMISGCSHGGYMREAFWLFYKMLVAEIEPNSFTFGVLFGACANSSAFQKGKQFHGHVLKIGLEANVVVGSAIVDMYSKCGEMGYAFRVFQSMPKRDIASWNGIICGFAQNGEAMKALKLYDELLLSEPPTISPNEVTFVGVLSACSHSGLIKEGFDLFNDMIHIYMIEPKAEHYTCMLDLLARAGLLKEAQVLMNALPFKPDVVMWSAMLGACKLHQNLQMATRIAGRLYADEPWNSSNYTLLFNSYTDNGLWSEAVEIRKKMDDRGVRKIVGCSWIEVESCMHSFVAGDKPCNEAVCGILQRLYLQMGERYEKELSLL